MDQLNNPNSSSTFPKPPTLNDKLKSKGKSGPQELSERDAALYHSMMMKSDAVAKGGNPYQSLAADVTSTPYAHELVRQAMFYVNKKPPAVKGNDSRLMEMALKRAMSGEARGRKQREVYSEYEKGGVREARRPSVRTLSRDSQGSSLNRLRAAAGRKRGRRRGRAASLVTGETLWAVGGSDSEGASDSEWGGAGRGGRDTEKFQRENTTASLGSILKKKSTESTKRKLKPLQMKGTALTAAALTEAAKWKAAEKKRGAIELAGTSLSLSSRAMLPHISLPLDREHTGLYHSLDSSKIGLAYPQQTEDVLGGFPAHLKPRRGLSTMSDNILLHRGGALRLSELGVPTGAGSVVSDTSSVASHRSHITDVSHKSRRSSFFHKK